MNIKTSRKIILLIVLLTMISATSQAAGLELLEIQDNLLAGISDSNRLLLFDITNLEELELLVEYEISAAAVDIALNQNLLFAALDGNGLEVVDISDQTAPRQLALYTEIDGVEEFEAKRIVIFGDEIFISDSRELYRFEVSDPSNISLIDHTSLASSIRNMAIINSSLYLALRLNGLQIMDITQPTPQLIGSDDSWTDDLLFDGSYVLTTANLFEEAKFAVVDISNPATPNELGSRSTYAGYDGVFEFHALANSSTFAYLAFFSEEPMEEPSYGFQIFNYETPQNILNPNERHTNEPVNDLKTIGDYLISAETSHLRVYDLTNPQNPVEVADWVSVPENQPGTTLPHQYAVVNTYPNPFNSSATIRIELLQSTSVRLSIHTVQGRLVSLVHDGQLPAGTSTISFDASHVASGVYLVRTDYRGVTDLKKLILIK